MGKLIDVTGQKFGKLTVIKRDESISGGAAYWICRCDCGKEISCKGTMLRRGEVRSCGCLQREDLTGQKFSYLTVLNYAYSERGQRYWNCLCDCGRNINVTTKSLKSGNTRSCGCLHSQTIRENNIQNKSKLNQVDIIGKTFDFLKVLERDDTKKSGRTHYICKCTNCGNVKSISYSDLISERIHACGCLNSWGEAQLRLKFNEYNIEYISQYSFKDLISKKKYPLRFDFAILKDENIVGLIEFQGEQHTDKNNPWYSEELLERDEMKKEYCKKNNIPLVYCDKNTNLDAFLKEVVFQWLSLESSI